MSEKTPYPVSIGVLSEEGHEGIHFFISEERTGFAHGYTDNDLFFARAVLLDLADAIELKMKKVAH